MSKQIKEKDPMRFFGIPKMMPLIKKYGKSIDKSLIGFPRTWKSLLM